MGWTTAYLLQAILRMILDKRWTELNPQDTVRLYKWFHLLTLLFYYNFNKIFKIDTPFKLIPPSSPLFIIPVWLAALPSCSILSHVLRGMEVFRASGSSEPAGLSHKLSLLLSKFPQSAWNSQGIQEDNVASEQIIVYDSTGSQVNVSLKMVNSCFNNNCFCLNYSIKSFRDEFCT